LLIIFSSGSNWQLGTACAKSLVAIPPAIIEPGFVAVAQAEGSLDFAVRFEIAAVDVPDAHPSLRQLPIGREAAGNP
jgi:hypothetical protein